MRVSLITLLKLHGKTKYFKIYGILVDLKMLEIRISAYKLKDKMEANVLSESVRTVPATAIYSIILYAVPFLLVSSKVYSNVNIHILQYTYNLLYYNIDIIICAMCSIIYIILCYPACTYRRLCARCVDAHAYIITTDYTNVFLFTDSFELLGRHTYIYS